MLLLGGGNFISLVIIIFFNSSSEGTNLYLFQISKRGPACQLQVLGKHRKQKPFFRLSFCFDKKILSAELTPITENKIKSLTIYSPFCVLDFAEVGI
jgi:hypothetical protein